MSDLIERGTVLDFVRRCKDRLQGKGLTYDILVDYIEAIPSAERKGEWIKQRDLTRIIDEYHCSYCDYSPKYKGIPIIPTSATMLYCPNCGCRMKGADDETD